MQDVKKKKKSFHVFYVSYHIWYIKLLWLIWYSENKEFKLEEKHLNFICNKKKYL